MRPLTLELLGVGSELGGERREPPLLFRELSVFGQPARLLGHSSGLAPQAIGEEVSRSDRRAVVSDARRLE